MYSVLVPKKTGIGKNLQYLSKIVEILLFSKNSFDYSEIYKIISVPLSSFSISVIVNSGEPLLSH